MRSSFGAVIVAALLNATTISGARAELRASERILADPCTRAAFAQLLYGAHPNIEVAAFVVEQNGGLTLLVWPRMAWIRSQTYTGVIPPGTIAIVHTHPPHEERPSWNDTREAARLALPLFVITATSIWLVDVDPEVRILSVAEKRWSDDIPKRLPAGCSPAQVAH